MSSPAKPRIDLDRLTKKLARMPAVRRDVVRRLKAEIAQGKYLTPGRLRKAIAELIRQHVGS